MHGSSCQFLASSEHFERQYWPDWRAEGHTRLIRAAGDLNRCLGADSSQDIHGSVNAMEGDKHEWEAPFGLDNRWNWASNKRAFQGVMEGDSRAPGQKKGCDAKEGHSRLLDDG
jgi:hypothetical protein